jgi:hypothetical protein
MKRHMFAAPVFAAPLNPPIISRNCACFATGVAFYQWEMILKRKCSASHSITRLVICTENQAHLSDFVFISQKRKRGRRGANFCDRYAEADLGGGGLANATARDYNVKRYSRKKIPCSFRGEKVPATRCGGVPSGSPRSLWRRSVQVDLRYFIGMVDGKQYVAITVGNGGAQAVTFPMLVVEIQNPPDRGAAIWAFELKEE